MQTVQEIKALLAKADAEEFEVLERSLAADMRKGVRNAVEIARRRLDAQQKEEARLAGLYSFQAEIAQAHNAQVVLGLDEVGRGSIAGPLAVGGVVLPAAPLIDGLNDSKQIAPARRESIAEDIRDVALAYTVQYVAPDFIDAHGMTLSLKKAFGAAIAAIEAQGVVPDIVLLDGNPLHLDEREVNVVKGDARCAAIAAASIVAKVERDALMCDLAKEYPAYDLDDCKGYASQKHIEAIKREGLSPIHRASFCTAFTQGSLF